jgi:hypothetical protein
LKWKTDIIEAKTDLETAKKHAELRKKHLNLKEKQLKHLEYLQKSEELDDEIDQYDDDQDENDTENDIKDQTNTPENLLMGLLGNVISKSLGKPVTSTQENTPLTVPNNLIPIIKKAKSVEELSKIAKKSGLNLDDETIKIVFDMYH